MISHYVLFIYLYRQRGLLPLLLTMPFRLLSIKRAVWAPVLVGLFISCCHPVASFSLVPCIKNQFTSTSSSLKAEDESNTNKDSLIRPTASIRVIYESDDVLAVHKPPHISHHDDPNIHGYSTANRERHFISRAPLGCASSRLSNFCSYNICQI